MKREISSNLLGLFGFWSIDKLNHHLCDLPGSLVILLLRLQLLCCVLIDDDADDHVIFPEGYDVAVFKHEIFLDPDEGPCTLPQIFEHVRVLLI